MENYFRVLVIVAMCLDSGSFDEISIFDIPTDVYELCPYSDICNKNASETLDKTGGLIPCCSSCSCHDDCGLHLNCCFDHLDKYKLVETGRFACLNPIIGLTKNETKVHHYGYYMVQQCDTESANNNPDNVRDQCNVTDEFGNSLIEPVSSLETSMIYVNKDCAACNKLNTNELHQWNYLFVSDFLRTVRDLTFEIEHYAATKKGKMIYEPPSDQDWTHKRCYNNFIEVQSCNNNKKLLEICHKFRLPIEYRSQRILGNVFCLRCKRFRKRTDHVCSKHHYERTDAADPERNVFSSSFSFLIDTSFIKPSKMLNSDALKSIQKAQKGCKTGLKNAKEVRFLLLKVAFCTATEVTILK